MNELKHQKKDNTLKKINREYSWLSFNKRVLLEALDKDVPIVERLRFLGIYSNNLDEFFRVRVGTLTRLIESDYKHNLNFDPREVLTEIHKMLKENERVFVQAFNQIRKELKKIGIHIISDTNISSDQKEWARDYFKKNIRIGIAPLIFKEGLKFPILKDKSIYLAIKLELKNGDIQYSLIEVPTDFFPRFVSIPHIIQGNHNVILLDDLIRLNLDEIYKVFDVKAVSAYTIKVTRNAELDLDSDFSKSDIEYLSKAIEKRKKANPVRFIADRKIPNDLLDFLLEQTNIEKHNVVLGGKYHNFKDFMDFPDFGIERTRYKSIEPIPSFKIEESNTILYSMDQQDILLFYPYNSFDYLLDFLRESSIDPDVEEIKMSLYRLSRKSQIVNILNTAAKNGKKVTVVMEITARFDEKNNIKWAKVMEEEGIKVLYGHPELKVHSKLVYVRKNVEAKDRIYCNISTGNFNEVTADLYSDLSLFTTNQEIGKEVEQVFDFIENNNPPNLNHLLMAPINMRTTLMALIEKEIENKKNGLPAKIIIKCNSLVDDKVIDKLYEAHDVGVSVKMIIRGICRLATEVPKEKQLKAVSIIDKFLEHARIFYFYNNGDEKCYISSADIMVRNLDYRVEVATPIYESKIIEKVMKFLKIQLKDNVKSRIHKTDLSNKRNKKNKKEKVRSQFAIYDWLEESYQNKVNKNI